MARQPRTVTLTLDEDTFAKARRRAAEENVSLSRFIGELLRRELRQGDEYESAYRTWRAAKPFALKGAAERYPQREELHDRTLLRRR
jgi:hypothetical protein